MLLWVVIIVKMYKRKITMVAMALMEEAMVSCIMINHGMIVSLLFTGLSIWNFLSAVPILQYHMFINLA